jgi:hypothetical protein
MKRTKGKTLRTISAVLFSALIVLSNIVPAYADTRWTDPATHETPSAYVGRTYTRTQWMRFYTNYYDSDQARTGTYTEPIGAINGLVFDDLSQQNMMTGYTAIEKRAAMSDKVSHWLEGYLGLNFNLHDSKYYLASPAFMRDQTQPVSIEGTSYFVQSSWPLSQHAEGSNQKQDVPVYVGTALPAGSQPYIDPLFNPVSSPLCIKNGPDVWQAGANNGAKTRYAWCGLASSEAAGGQPTIGNIDLTKTAAANVLGSVFDLPPGATGHYMTSGYVTASFPYNLFVTGVTRQAGGSGSTAYYDWSVVNQTPLWLKNITVRVYTRGASTNTWNLASVYRNIDMPPATTDGVKLKYGSRTEGSYMTASGSAIVTPSGVWSVAKPMVNTSVPVPAEDYDVVVTANVNLNVTGGRLGTPSVDTGMTATYWNGAAPPGLPSLETKESWNKASSIIGISLPSGYNDNVASANDNTGISPPGGGGSAPPTGHNLAATSLSKVSSNSLSFTFTGNMPVAGTAYVRFYVKASNGSLSGYGSVRYVRIAAREGATVTTTDVPLQLLSPGTVIYASVDATSSDGNTWIPDPAQGFSGDDGRSYPEITYLDNYTVTILEGSSPPGGFTPAPQEETHPTTYPLMKNTITMQETQTPVEGWKKVPYSSEEPTATRPRVRLVPTEPFNSGGE